MMNLSAVLFLVLSSVSSVSSFSFLAPVRTSKTVLAASTATQEVVDSFYKAVQLASEHVIPTDGIDLEEFDRLATQLEDLDGCTFEKEEGEELCDKEIQDRLDVADILRLKIELQLRLNYLENANLFADDVRKEHDKDERKKFKDDLIANREKVSNAHAQAGSDLGLW